MKKIFDAACRPFLAFAVLSALSVAAILIAFDNAKHGGPHDLTRR
jgi:hypothetical protein